MLNHLYFLYVVLCSLQGFSFEALWLHESADYAKISSVFTFCCLRNVPRAGLTVQILRTRYEWFNCGCQEFDKYSHALSKSEIVPCEITKCFVLKKDIFGIRPSNTVKKNIIMKCSKCHHCGIKGIKAFLYK